MINYGISKIKKLLILLMLVVLPVSAKEYSSVPYNVKFDIPDNYHIATYETHDKIFDTVGFNVEQLKQMMLREHIAMICIDLQKEIEINIVIYVDSNSQLIGDLSDKELSDNYLLTSKFAEAIKAETQLEDQCFNLVTINACKYFVLDGGRRGKNGYEFHKKYITVKNGMIVVVNGITYSPGKQHMFSDLQQIVTRMDYSHSEDYTNQSLVKETGSTTLRDNSDSKNTPIYKAIIGGLSAALVLAIRYFYIWFKERRKK